MKNFIAVGLLGLSLMGVQSSTASAATVALDVNSGWSPFSFYDVGSSWDTDFTLTLTKSATLKVTDAYLSGDQFAVNNTFSFFGLPITLPLGVTSSPTQGDSVGANYDAAYADPNFSHAAFLLGPGTYDISGTVLQSPYGYGGAAVELVSTVPLPASAPMFGAALLALGVVGFRLKRKAASAA